MVLATCFIHRGTYKKLQWVCCIYYLDHILWARCSGVVVVLLRFLALFIIVHHLSHKDMQIKEQEHRFATLRLTLKCDKSDFLFYYKDSIVLLMLFNQ